MKLRALATALLAALVPCSRAAAQALVLDPPRLVVRAAEAPVRLAALDVRVVIQGLTAETTETLTFLNSNARALEGELQFPLPDGAALCGFALDVEGQLVEGAILPRDRARAVLQAELRKGVDPGLVEQVRGNVHRARVYPIPARGTRTVRLRWIAPLLTRGAEAAYHLPLPYREKLPEVALRVEVVRAPVTPDVSGGFGNLTLKQAGDRWVAEERLRDAAAGRELLVRLPGLPARWLGLEAGPDAATFDLAERVPAAPGQALPAPRRVALAWDASGSRDAVATERELAFLRALLAAWPRAGVDLVVFRDRPERPRAFAAGDVEALLAALRAEPQDGGTALAALDLSRAALPSRDDDLWLVLSDGLASLGEALPALGGVPVYPVTGATEADRPLLRHLAAATGGALTDLVALGPAAAVKRLTAPRARLAQVTATPAGAVADVELAEPADPAWARVSARLLAPEAELTLTFAAGGEEVERRTVTVRRADAAPAGDLPGPVALRWAEARAEALGLFPDRNAEALLALGRRFGLVTAGTSILVLESLEQHLQHEVEPAASRPALRAAYLAAVADRKKLRLAADEDALQAVVRTWQERVAWWERTFDVPAGWRWQAAKQRNGAAREDLAASAEAAPMSMALPAPAPVAVGGALSKTALAEKKEGGGEAATPASISIQPWDPDVPYLRAMKAAPKDGAYAAYLAQRRAHAGPAFYLDCAGFFLRAGQQALGVRVLTNLAELGLDDPGLLRVMAWRLSEAGALELAAQALEKVIRLAPEEPQFRRDLALVLSERAEAANRPADAARAVQLLWEVGRRSWDRAPDLELVSLMELNRILARAERRGWDEVGKAAPVDPRVKKLLTLDLRVSLAWDTDMTDVDLHVLEPTGEHAFYGHRETRLGGLVSHDVTQGYGPEEYVVRRALPGAYQVKVHYYGSGQQTLVGPATLVATVYTNWGRPDEKKQLLTLRLDAPRELEPVGVVQIGGK